jgi:hypothetical protein
MTRSLPAKGIGRCTLQNHDPQSSQEQAESQDLKISAGAIPNQRPGLLLLFSHLCEVQDREEQ